MRSRTNFILLFVLVHCAAGSTLLAQAPLSTPHGFSDLKKVSSGTWTLLSDKDDLVFYGQRGTCNGHAQFWLKAENKSSAELHVFVGVQFDNVSRSPKQILILKPGQIQEFTCASQHSLIMIPIRDGTNPAVSLEYQINKRL